jgi:hypothetical protein
MSMQRDMNPLFGLLAVPTAGAALDAVKGAVSAVSRPFADVLGALADQTQPAAAVPNNDDERDDLNERVAARLQEIFEAAGAAPGDCSSVSYDDATGEIEVNDGSPSGADAQAAIQADEQLMDCLRQMAANDESPDDRLDLLVQMS